MKSRMNCLVEKRLLVLHTLSAMKRSSLRVLALCLISPLPALAQPAGKQSETTAKKGIGLAERHGMGEPQLAALKAGWYYNWGSETKLKSSANFVPMIFSLKHVDDRVKGTVVLGYNEPDNEKQSNIAVTDALAGWPQIARKAGRIGSPAMAGNPLTKEWLKDFLKTSPKVDFIAVHWYKGADAKHFIRDIEAIHAAFGKPIWVTEYAPQTAASSEKEPSKFSQDEVDRFIIEASRWMERTPWVERYAWHDSRAGTSALFNAQGELTLTGKTYASHPQFK